MNKEDITQFVPIETYKQITFESVADIVSNENYNLKYLVNGLFYEKTINILTGDTGVGKSLFTEMLAGCLSKGLPFIDKFTIEKEMNIAFLDRENGKAIIKDRFTKIDSNHDKMFYITLDGYFNDDNLIELKKFFVMHEIDVLIIDTYIRFGEGDTKDAKDSNAFYSKMKLLLDDLKAIFIIHHLRKVSSGTGKKRGNQDANGTVDIIASADSHFMLLPAKEEHNLTVRNAKNRIAEPVDDFTYSIENLEDNKIKFNYVGTLKEAAHKKHVLTEDLIIQYIGIYGKAQNNDDLYSYLKVNGGFSSKPRVLEKLSKMVEEKTLKIKKIGNAKHYFAC